jgi:TRAP-type C4-dicarboxylate transport system substrate-binding protein
MKCNVKRSWDSLKPAERRALEKSLQEWANLQADKENEKVQEFLIKMHCIWMRDREATDEEIFDYIAWMKRTYRRVARCKTEAEQNAWMDAELARCFPGGFPQFRIDDMKSKERSIFDG